MLSALSELSAIASTPRPGPDDVVHACEVIRGAVGATDAYVLRAGDPHYVKVGKDGDPTLYDVKQKGYWLVWRDLASNPELPAASFVVEDRLVQSGTGLEAGTAATHIAAILPAPESNSEMLIVHGPWPNGLSEKERQFIVAARTALAYLVCNTFDMERQARLRDQLSALSDVSRAFSQANKIDTVLQDLANALAKASGFDWATITITNDTHDAITERVMNVARYSNTQTAQMSAPLTLPVTLGWIREMLRTHTPRLVPDVFASDLGYSPELIAYYERAHLLSTASFPILLRDELLGAVLFSSCTKRSFPEEEVAFLGALVSQAASSIKGVLLYHDLERSRADLKRHAGQLEEMNRVQHFVARTDTLTGIPNRRLIEEVLRAESTRSKRDGGPFSVVMADVDWFKLINDSFGHQAGDEALRLVASVARQNCGATDFVGRWGGDEFFFILPASDLEVARVFADRFRIAVSEARFQPKGADDRLSISMSAGVAQADLETSDSPDYLVNHADEALYTAKECGRNRVVSWNARAAA